MVTTFYDGTAILDAFSEIFAFLLKQYLSRAQKVYRPFVLFSREF